MKIIEEGKLPYQKKTQVQCDRCKSVIEVCQYECNYSHSAGKNNWWEFRCPFPGCMNTVYVYTWDKKEK